MKYIKFEPSNYIFVYKRGKLTKKGKGLAFWYVPRKTSIIMVPIQTMTIPFVYNEITTDYQNVTVQGEMIYRICEPEKIIEKVNFSIDSKRLKYISDDPMKVSDRIVNVIKTMVTKEIAKISLKDAMRASDMIIQSIYDGIKSNAYMESLGVEITAINILSILPNKETARALEAKARESILKDADDAIYDRRNSAVEQERKIKENELNTDIAIEKKQRQIRETQMEAEQAIKEKERDMLEEDLQFEIKQENEKLELTGLIVKNKKEEAQIKAFALKLILDAFKDIDVNVVRALASINMDSDKIIASAFDVMADNADKIGELNISPDLIQKLLDKRR